MKQLIECKKSIEHINGEYQTNIKKRTYYIINDLINIKDFDSSLIKIEENSYKNIDTYNIGYIIIKRNFDYENINSINSLYLIIGKADEYIKEKQVFSCYFYKW